MWLMSGERSARKSSATGRAVHRARGHLAHRIGGRKVSATADMQGRHTLTRTLCFGCMKVCSLEGARGHTASGTCTANNSASVSCLQCTAAPLQLESKYWQVTQESWSRDARQFDFCTFHMDVREWFANHYRCHGNTHVRFSVILSMPHTQVGLHVNRATHAPRLCLVTEALDNLR